MEHDAMQRYIGDKPVSEDEYWETLIARGDVTSRPNARDDAEEAYERDQDAVARAHHEEWKRWIVQGGYADHKYQAAKINHPIPGLNTCDVCGQVFPKHHPDMVPWDSLPEAKRGKYRARAAYLLGFAAGREGQIPLSREEWALLVEVVEEWLLQPPFSWRNYDVVEEIHSKLAVGVKSV